MSLCIAVFPKISSGLLLSLYKSLRLNIKMNGKRRAAAIAAALSPQGDNAA
jgi:hypothetical protein